jgi:hypothetical protein
LSDRQPLLLRSRCILLAHNFAYLAFYCSLPLIWLIRVGVLKLPWLSKLSVWTGAPIITVAKNCRAERRLGVRSVSVVKTTYFTTDEFDWVLNRLAGGSRLMTFVFEYLAFLVICLSACQVHAYFDGGILSPRRRRQFNPLELNAYRLLRIRLFVWTYGADVRTREATRRLGEPNCCTDCTQVGLACICDDTAGHSNFERVKSVATACFSMGDMIEYTSGSKNGAFFWPIDLDADLGKRYMPTFPDEASVAPLRVVHAPNHREYKGSRYLEAAIATLREEGADIELVMVERVSNDEALRIYRSADVIFDQCLIGFHGYFALEAMALGKPVMCYIRKPDEYLLHPNECPIINTHRDTVADDLRRLIGRRYQLRKLGEQGRRYVELYYSQDAFASRLRAAYADLGVMF